MSMSTNLKRFLLGVFLLTVIAGGVVLLVGPRLIFFALFDAGRNDSAEVLLLSDGDLTALGSLLTEMGATRAHAGTILFVPEGRKADERAHLQRWSLARSADLVRGMTDPDASKPPELIAITSPSWPEFAPGAIAIWLSAETPVRSVLPGADDLFWPHDDHVVWQSAVDVVSGDGLWQHAFVQQFTSPAEATRWFARDEVKALRQQIRARSRHLVVYVIAI